MRLDRSKPRSKDRSLGQSVTEFALILPVFLLIVLIGLDFGRVYLGWINLQQMARIAANYAADHASGWPDDPVVQARYARMVQNDAAQSNCTLPGGVVPQPVFAVPNNPRPTGSEVTVNLECEFGLITPIIGDILGNPITAGASSTFPVKEGVVYTGAVGGGGVAEPPTAAFTVSPGSGWAPLTVDFTDHSTFAGSWDWTFAESVGGTGTGSVSQPGSTEQNPSGIIYDCVGAPGDTCTFKVRLHVVNSIDVSDAEESITVTIPAADGPLAEFSGAPRTGDVSLTVTFSFVQTAGRPAPTSFDWNFGDGSAIGHGATVTHTYTNDGTTPKYFDVSLTVSDGANPPSTVTKTSYIELKNKVCTVPDFANIQVNSAPHLWESAGFTGAFKPQSGSYKIKTQSLVGGTIDPQPGGCASSITVGP